MYQICVAGNINWGMEADENEYMNVIRCSDWSWWHMKPSTFFGVGEGSSPVNILHYFINSNPT